MERATKAFAWTAAAAASLAGCAHFGGGVPGSGKIATQVRDVGSFTRIEVAGAFDVQVSVGPDTKVEIQTDDNLLPLVQTDVASSTLTISTKKNISPRMGLRVIISTPSLEGVSLAGSGDLRVGPIKGPRFSISLSGSGSVAAWGKAQTLSLSIAGSGGVEASGFASGDAEVEIAGSGDASIGPSETLKASISGSGNIKYEGDPIITKSISGSGDVSRR